MIRNRHGHEVETGNITEVHWQDGGCAIESTASWGHCYISKDELDGFVPQTGDMVVMITSNVSLVHGIIIEHRVIRYTTKKQAEEKHKQMVDGFRLDKLERYVKHGPELKARAEKLPSPLRTRIQRFAAEGGEEFWIEDAPYEMICLEGAAALLKKTAELLPYPPRRSAISGKFATSEEKKAVDEQRIKWIEEWWDKPYNEQQELVPDFGDGHSGFTASAGRGLAIMVLKGEPV